LTISGKEAIKKASVERTEINEREQQKVVNKKKKE
jgi:hypothetical protein